MGSDRIGERKTKVQFLQWGEDHYTLLVVLHMFDYSPLCGHSNSSAMSRLVLSYPYQTLMYRDVAALAQAHTFAV